MPHDLEPWRLLAQREILSDPRIHVTVETVALPDGRIVDDYYRVILGDSVSIFAETEDGRILVLRQYKHGPRRISLTMPGGHREAGEDWQSCAKRELMEETGHAAEIWEELGRFVQNDNRFCGETHFFRARNCRPVAPIAHGDLEEMQLIEMTRAELISAAAKGEFTSVGQIALLAIATHPELSRAS